MQPTRYKMAVRLGGIVLLLALTISRLTLILHELIGHGLTALLVGGSVGEYRLFVFGGGWIRTSGLESLSTSRTLVVHLGGIGLELLLGLAALAVAQWRGGRGLARLAALCVATILLLHAGFYLAAGTFHGFGDGRSLYALLGEQRGLLAFPVAGGLILLSGWLATQLVPVLRAWSAQPDRKGQLLVAGAAILLAGAGHATLTLGERAFVSDEAYRSVMSSQAERRALRELEEYRERVREETGAPPSEEALQAKRERVRAEHRTFPLHISLALGIALAFALGGLRTRPPIEFYVPNRRSLLLLGWLTLASIGLVVLLRPPW